MADDAPEGGDRGAGVLLRRTWPQRAAVTACLIVITAALILAYWIDVAHSGARKVQRIDFAVAATADPAVGYADHTREAEADDTGADDPAPPEVSPGSVDGTGGDGSDGQILQTDTPEDAPVNFLIVGTDSALGLDPDDPVLHGRHVDPTGRSRADAIMLLRLDPASGSAWALSIPRDLWVEIPRGQENRITSALWIGGGPLLVETITSTFGVEINHYTQVDFAGFQALVDALGGVPVWFPHPARDPGSRLNIPSAGCHVLDGRQALQYVRGRRYTEQIRGRWQLTGGSDLSRIERQQDFLVLALDRAIERGARNPRVMTSLFESITEMVALDQDLTLSELISLGETFIDFNPDDLHRQRLDVYTVRWPDGGYKGEAAYVRRNQAILDVFRGLESEVRPSEERVKLAGAAAAVLSAAAEALTQQGFAVSGSEVLEESIPATVVLHGPGRVGEAMTVARYLRPLPHMVVRDDVEGVVAVLGDDYRGIRAGRPPSFPEAESRITARGEPTVLPDLAVLGVGEAETATRGQSSPLPIIVGRVDPGAGAAVLVRSPGQTAASVTHAASSDGTPTTTSAPVVITGRAPEGESCG